MAETPDQINESMYKIVRLSPTAKHSVIEQKYNMSFPVEEVDIEAVRQETFVGLVEDLSSIGVYFTCPNEEIYSDNAYTLEATLRVLEYIMPSTLYIQMRRFPRLVQGIKSILTGVSEDPVMEDYLTFLGGSSNKGGMFPALAPDTEFLFTRLRNSGVFIDYLESMVSLIEEEKVIAVSPLPDPNAWTRFKQKVTDRSATALAFLDQALREGSTEDPEALLRSVFKRIQVSLLMPMALPEQQPRLAFLYLTDANTLSASMQGFYRKVLTEWKATSKVFVRYFTERSLPMGPTEALTFVVYAFCTTDTPVQFENSIKVLMTEAPSIIQIISAVGDKLMSVKEKEVLDV